MTKLAIIVPAYKKTFLSQSLQSIFSQTDQRFNLYVGNDNSPEDIDGIIEKYLCHPNLFYKKFDNNLGSKSLVKQWERCIEMMGDEEWIWLFSDDDVMDKTAVENFYKMKPEPNNVYRFNLNIIDKENKLLSEVEYNRIESVFSFLSNRLRYKYNNVITNYIFSRKSYRRVEGFVDFPLAWGSDDASIIQFAEAGEILLIEGCKISWRSSGANISMIINKELGGKKILARIAFIKWLYKNKNFLITGIDDNKRIVARWFTEALKIEYYWASDRQKYRACQYIYPYVGNIVFRMLLLNKKKQDKSTGLQVH